MTPNEYQKAALRTEGPKWSYTPSGDVLRVFLASREINIPEKEKATVRLLEGVMGLSGEAGEACDIVKKVLFQGHQLDREHVALELGDICWYLALASDAIGYDLEEIMQMNIDKLYARYPDGFEVEKSVHRKENDI